MPAAFSTKGNIWSALPEVFYILDRIWRWSTEESEPPLRKGAPIGLGGQADRQTRQSALMQWIGKCGLPVS